MAVFEHVSNNLERKKFLILVHEQGDGTYDAVLMDYYTDELGEECIVAKKIHGLTEVKRTEWTISSEFSSGFAIYSKFMRKM